MQNTRRHQIRIRENDGSLDFNFILLLNPAVDENWVCRHHLLQFILEKCCCIRCSDLFKHFVNSKFTKRFHFFGAQIDLFIIFVCSFYRQWATIRFFHHFGFMCMLILGYAVHIFSATDAKYVMFCIGWCKSLKGSRILNQYNDN